MDGVARDVQLMASFGERGRVDFSFGLLLSTSKNVKGPELSRRTSKNVKGPELSTRKRVFGRL